MNGTPSRRRARKTPPAGPYDDVLELAFKGLDQLTPAAAAKPSRSSFAPVVAGGLVVVAIAAGFMAMILLARRPGPAPAAPLALTMRWSAAGELQECSPFASLDGRRLLAFNAERRRVAEGAGARSSDDQAELDALLEAIAAGAPSARFPEGIRAGSFEVDDVTDRVVLALPGEAQSYTLLEPMPLGADGCVLVAGDLAAADLTRSWFGAAAAEPAYDTPEAGP